MYWYSQSGLSAYVVTALPLPSSSSSPSYFFSSILVSFPGLTLSRTTHALLILFSVFWIELRQAPDCSVQSRSPQLAFLSAATAFASSPVSRASPDVDDAELGFGYGIYYSFYLETSLIHYRFLSSRSSSQTNPNDAGTPLHPHRRRPLAIVIAGPRRRRNKDTRRGSLRDPRSLREAIVLWWRAAMP